MKFATYMNEAAASKGFAYEGEIIDKVKEACPDLKVKEMGAGADSNSPDLVITYKGKQLAIELKLNKNAQMGGSSVQLKGKEFKFLNDVDEILEAAFEEFVDKNGEAFTKFFKFIQSQEPKEYHKNVDSFPLTCTKKAWTDAVSEGHLKPLNTKVQFNTDFIATHYKKKGVDYIQLGGLGLFYLTSDIAKLGVPKLEGELNVEIRPARGGSRDMKSLGEKVVGAGIRVQGRLKTKNKSSKSLDKIEDIKDLFGK